MATQTTTYSNKYKHLADLAASYAQAGKTNQAARFYRMAGDKAAIDYANDEALEYYNQALTLTSEPNAHDRFRILLAREQLYGLLGKADEQLKDLKMLETLANCLNSDGMRGEVAIRQAHYHENKGAYDTAITLAQLAARLAHHISAPLIKAEALLAFGKALTRQGNYQLADARLQEALELAQQSDQLLLQADIFRALGILANEQKKLSLAVKYDDRALALYKAEGSKLGQTHILNNLGHIEQMQGHLTAALGYWDEAQTMFEELGDREGQVRVLINLSTINIDTGRYQEAAQYNQQALAICREIKLRIGQCFALLNLGLVAHYQEQNNEALGYLEEALALAEMMGSKQLQASSLSILGHAYTALNEEGKANKVYWEALAIWDELQLANWSAETLAGMARLKVQEAKLDSAFSLVDEILLTIEEDPELQGVEGPIRVYWTCYQVLEKMGDSRAVPLLQQGYQQLQRLLAEVADSSLKESMQANISAHRKLLDAYRATV